MLTAEKLGTRLTIIIILGLIAITGYFIANNYFTSKYQLEESILSKLHCIATTTALKIDGDYHEELVKKYTQIN